MASNTSHDTGAHGIRLEAQTLGDLLRIGDGLDPFGRSLGVDQDHRRTTAKFSFVQPLLAQYVALRYARVLRDLANSQVIVEQDSPTPLFLRVMMLRMRSPANQRFLIAPT